LDEGAGDRAAFLVEDPPLDDDALAERRALVLCGQIGRVGPGPALGEERAGDFRQRVLEPDRLALGRPFDRAGVVGIEIRRLGPRPGAGERRGACWHTPCSTLCPSSPGLSRGSTWMAGTSP